LKGVNEVNQKKKPGRPKGSTNKVKEVKETKKDSDIEVMEADNYNEPGKRILTFNCFIYNIT